jgi:hypothetical protein
MYIVVNYACRFFSVYARVLLNVYFDEVQVGTIYINRYACVDVQCHKLFPLNSLISFFAKMFGGDR